MDNFRGKSRIFIELVFADLIQQLKKFTSCKNTQKFAILQVSVSWIERRFFMTTLIDIGIGILLFILPWFLEDLISLIFRDPFSGVSSSLTSGIFQYLFTAVLYFVISLAFAWIFRTREKARAWRRAIIWTLTSALLTLALVIITAARNADMIAQNAETFSWSSLGTTLAVTFAVLLGVFLGPIVYARIKNLP